MKSVLLPIIRADTGQKWWPMAQLLVRWPVSGHVASENWFLVVGWSQTDQDKIGGVLKSYRGGTLTLIAGLK